MRVLFEKHQIEKRINEISSQILSRHKNDTTPVVLICVLNGGFMFYSKLTEQLYSLDPECDFTKVKSYEGQYRDELEIQLYSSINVINKHVYIIDDIYDSGMTMNSLKEFYVSQGAKNVDLIALIKRSINEINIPSNSIYGFEIQDEWVVGFGLDDDEGAKRSFPYILAVR